MTLPCWPGVPTRGNRTLCMFAAAGLETRAHPAGTRHARVTFLAVRHGLEVRLRVGPPEGARVRLPRSIVLRAGSTLQVGGIVIMTSRSSSAGYLSRLLLLFLLGFGFNVLGDVISRPGSAACAARRSSARCSSCRRALKSVGCTESA